MVFPKKNFIQHLLDYIKEKYETTLNAIDLLGILLTRIENDDNSQVTFDLMTQLMEKIPQKSQIKLYIANQNYLKLSAKIPAIKKIENIIADKAMGATQAGAILIITPLITIGVIAAFLAPAALFLPFFSSVMLIGAIMIGYPLVLGLNKKFAYSNFKWELLLHDVQSNVNDDFWESTNSHFLQSENYLKTDKISTLVRITAPLASIVATLVKFVTPYQSKDDFLRYTEKTALLQPGYAGRNMLVGARLVTSGVFYPILQLPGGKMQPLAATFKQAGTFFGSGVAKLTQGLFQAASYPLALLSIPFRGIITVVSRTRDTKLITAKPLLQPMLDACDAVLLYTSKKPNPTEEKHNSLSVDETYIIGDSSHRHLEEASAPLPQNEANSPKINEQKACRAFFDLSTYVLAKQRNGLISKDKFKNLTNYGRLNPNKLNLNTENINVLKDELFELRNLMI